MNATKAVIGRSRKDEMKPPSASIAPGAAAQIARRLGARVIGADKQAPHPYAPIYAIAERLIVGAQDLPAEVRAATEGKGADVVFDLVGGVMFRNALGSLAPGGRLVEIAATGQREVHFDLADFYHNESRLFGVDTRHRDAVASGALLEALTPVFEQGTFKAPKIDRIIPLSEGRTAYEQVARGEARGRVVLAP